MLKSGLVIKNGSKILKRILFRLCVGKTHAEGKNGNVTSVIHPVAKDLCSLQHLEKFSFQEYYLDSSLILLYLTKKICICLMLGKEGKGEGSRGKGEGEEKGGKKS